MQFRAARWPTDICRLSPPASHDNHKILEANWLNIIFIVFLPVPYAIIDGAILLQSNHPSRPFRSGTPAKAAADRIWSKSSGATSRSQKNIHKLKILSRKWQDSLASFRIAHPSRLSVRAHNSTYASTTHLMILTSSERVTFPIA